MKPIRALLVDDESHARDTLRHLLQKQPDVEVVGECANGTAAVEAIRRTTPDLVFLDIQMPGLSGFDVLRAVGGGRKLDVVFVTAYDQYALQAFEVNAVDYLLKPYSDARFHDALHRARTRLAERSMHELNDRLEKLLVHIDHTPRANGREEEFIDRLPVKQAGDIFFLDVDEIDWVEAQDNYVGLHVDKKKHLLRETMSGLEKKLDPRRFVRVHRSAIINVDRVRVVQPEPSGEYAIVLENGTTLHTSRGFRDRLRKVIRF